MYFVRFVEVIRYILGYLFGIMLILVERDKWIIKLIFGYCVYSEIFFIWNFKLFWILVFIDRDWWGY